MSPPENKNMHVLDSDIAVAAALLVFIANAMPDSDPEILGDLAPLVAADVSYWRRRRAAGSAIGRPAPAIAARHATNRALYDIYHQHAAVPHIIYGETSAGPPEPYVEMLSPAAAAAIYSAPETLPRRPPGRPRKSVVSGEEEPRRRFTLEG